MAYFIIGGILLAAFWYSILKEKMTTEKIGGIISGGLVVFMLLFALFFSIEMGGWRVYLKPSPTFQNTFLL